MSRQARKRPSAPAVFRLFLLLILGKTAFVQAEALLPLPPAAPATRLKLEIGKKLFHDPRLSLNRDISCASCHPLAHGGTDGHRFSQGTGGTTTTYNTPTIFNAAIVKKYGWEGIAQSLVEVTRKAMTSSKAMGMSSEAAALRLKEDAAMVRDFRLAFGLLSGDTVLEALSIYMEQLMPRNSPFDRYLRGDQQALTSEQKQGYQRFIELGCVSCHQGAGVGGNMFARFGVMIDPFRSDPQTNTGRFNATQQVSDLHVFRVPSLRNVALTAPYFHDGRAADLISAVRTMGYVQLRLRLSDDDLRVLLAFLNSLTGQLPAEVLP